MQTTSSRLGVDSVFVRGVVTPREGASLDLQITLPGGARLIVAKATVVERVPPNVKGKEAGFLARFDAISQDAREALEKALAPHKSPSGPPKRAFIRIPIKLEVGWNSARDFLVVYAENISAGGIFVVLPDPPQLREVVELSLKLPDGLPPAKTNAQVIQRLTAEEAKHLGRQPGAGLQFVGSDDDFRQRLDLCIENLLVQPKH